LEVVFLAPHPRAARQCHHAVFISVPLFVKKTRIFRAHPPGFAFYLLLFSPTASLDFPSRPPFRAIIKL
jgi:hypothetical protein